MKVQRQSGFTLIEILIAVFVLAVGLLGVAALQMTSLVNGQEGALRTQALAIANDLAARSRLNGPTAAIDPLTLGAYLAGYVAAPAVCAAPPAPMCRTVGAVAGQTCNTAQMTAFDLWEACVDAQTQLPQGLVHTRLVAGNRLVIGVGWMASTELKGRGEGDVDSGDDGTVNINPVCNGALGMPANYNCVVVDVVPY